MLIILIAIYTRTDPAISIIFIFLIRIFQNQYDTKSKSIYFKEKKINEGEF